MTPANAGAAALARDDSKEPTPLMILAHRFAKDNPYKRTTAERSRQDRAKMLKTLGAHIDEIASQLMDPGIDGGYPHYPLLFSEADAPLTEDDAEHLASCFLDAFVGSISDFAGISEKLREFLRTEIDHSSTWPAREGGGER